MEIPLTKGKIAIIDDLDYPITAAFKWWSVRSRTNDRWYAATKISGKRVWMHSLITGYPMTDHRDSDGLNNRRSNLRRCNSSQNSANRRKRPGQTSRFKGVAWNKEKEMWSAQIRTAGRTRFLGYFVDEEAAARTYQAKATEIFGEFARY